MEYTFDNNIPIYIQLLEYLKIYLISGVFKCGEKLPSVREFATTFKVNPNTMQKALAELESLNLIYTERTNGKYVTKDSKIILPLSIKITSSNILSISEIKCVEIITLALSLKLDKIVSKM